MKGEKKPSSMAHISAMAGLSLGPNGRVYGGPNVITVDERSVPRRKTLLIRRLARMTFGPDMWAPVETLVLSITSNRHVGT